jgi:hypothetical protein
VVTTSLQASCCHVSGHDEQALQVHVRSHWSHVLVLRLRKACDMSPMIYTPYHPLSIILFWQDIHAVFFLLPVAASCNLYNTRSCKDISVAVNNMPCTTSIDLRWCSRTVHHRNTLNTNVVLAMWAFYAAVLGTIQKFGSVYCLSLWCVRHVLCISLP